MGVPDHLTCLLRNQYAGQKAAIRTLRGTTDSKRGKEYKGLYCHPFYLTYTQSTSSRLDVSQTGIKIARRNISNLRYTDDSTLMAESEEELMSLLMKVIE